MGATTFGMAVYMLILAKTGSNLTKPDKLLFTCMNYISEQNYKKMYQMLDVDASGQIREEDFIKRNSAIYEGIEVHNIITTIISYDVEPLRVSLYAIRRSRGKKRGAVLDSV